jgi:threonine synthase
MKFIGTRGTKEKKNFSEVILNPAAPKGGLYSPENLPSIDKEFITKYTDYKSLAKAVLKKFEIDINDESLDKALNLYDKFDSKDVVPVKKVENNLFIAELWHGPTRAFKDMALQPFGSVLSDLAKERNENYLILAATSGDTGPATLETFRDKENVKVACMYPENGTSDVQRLQMVMPKMWSLDFTFCGSIDFMLASGAVKS